ncbi:MAG TPA: hypothetical protein VGI63_10480 [Verrucomicrobiae bacterium]|jgi:hypothetical protein
MSQSWQYVCLVFASYICICKADDNLATRQFIESCYGASYDPKTEITDTILVDARYTDQVQIKKLADEVVQKYKHNTNSAAWNGLLGDLFMESSMSNNANIQLFRERIMGEYYRLDVIPDFGTFPQLDWKAGQFTNEHPFLLSRISTPPNNTNLLWTLYEMQPNVNRMGIKTGEHKLIPSADFYVHLNQLSSLLMGNIMLQTADLAAMKLLAKSHNFANDDPDDFSLFKIDEKRLGEAIGEKGMFKNWGVRPLQGDVEGLKQLSVIRPDGFDRDGLRVIFNESDPKQRYLAYMRDNDGNIVTLVAWDYNQKGTPLRFLRIEQQPDGKLVAWAQNIILMNKTTNVDWSIFSVDISKYSSIYDQRGKYPIQTVNGKVVFDASKDKYSPFPGKAGSVQSNWFDSRTIIRVIMLIVLLVPPLIMLFKAFKKRQSK